MLQGIDVYAGDGPVEWHKVAEVGNAFVFVRGAYGNTVDKTAAPNAADARSVGLTVGVYHFFRARLDPHLQMQALKTALDSAKLGAGDMPPVLDVEDNPAYDGNWNVNDNATYLASLHDWIKQVQRIGTPPIIYTLASFWSQLEDPSGFADCPLWVASYRDNAPKLLKGWQDYAFWQYSDAGSTFGIAGHVDMNYFNGDRESLQAHLI